MKILVFDYYLTSSFLFHSYFPLERVFMSLVPDGDHAMIFLAGTAAGAMNAIILNPLSALKYKTWGREVNRGMPTEALDMWRKAGLR
jgi:hypothetical protein